MNILTNMNSSVKNVIDSDSIVSESNEVTLEDKDPQLIEDFLNNQGEMDLLMRTLNPSISQCLGGVLDIMRSMWGKNKI